MGRVPLPQAGPGQSFATFLPSPFPHIQFDKHSELQMKITNFLKWSTKLQEGNFAKEKEIITNIMFFFTLLPNKVAGNIYGM